MRKLTSTQRELLLKKAAGLKRTLIIAQEGVKPNSVWGLNSRLASEQLVKVEFNSQSKTEILAMSEELASKTDSEVLCIVNNWAVFFKQHPNSSIDALLK